MGYPSLPPSLLPNSPFSHAPAHASTNDRDGGANVSVYATFCCALPATVVHPLTASYARADASAESRAHSSPLGQLAADRLAVCSSIASSHSGTDDERADPAADSLLRVCRPKHVDGVAAGLNRGDTVGFLPRAVRFEH